MPNFTFRCRLGKTYKITMPEEKPGLKSSYIFAYPKSGSTLLNNMISTYCIITDTPWFSLFDQAFGQGIITKDITEDALVCFKPEGYVYTGFRYYPSFDLPLHDSPCVLLVRDPRDMLVSLYFSLLKSHMVPDGNAELKRDIQSAKSFSIDDYLIKRSYFYVSVYTEYKFKLSNANLTIYRYEDVIYHKRNWLTELVNKLGLVYKKEHINTVASQFDIIPKSENSDNHIRQVHPGDHKAKLKPETIEKLNNILGTFLKDYNYL